MCRAARGLFHAAAPQPWTTGYAQATAEKQRLREAEQQLGTGQAGADPALAPHLHPMRRPSALPRAGPINTGALEIPLLTNLNQGGKTIFFFFFLTYIVSKQSIREHLSLTRSIFNSMQAFCEVCYF